MVSILEVSTYSMSFLYVAILLLLATTIMYSINPLNKGILTVCFIMASVLTGRSLLGLFYMRLKVGFENGMFEAGMVLRQFMIMIEPFSPYLIYLGLLMTISLAGYAIYCSWPRRRYVIPSRLVQGDQYYMPEKAMPNSKFEHTKVLPPFQAMIMASTDGKIYHNMGQCFWIEEGILTAAHVIEGFDFLNIYRDEEHNIDVKPEVFQIGDGDYAICREPSMITQKVGLAKAKLSRIAIEEDAGLSVNITAMDKRTIGFLSRHPQFGYVSYNGSTTKGFSGAPYYFGRTVFGMHLGSDSKNMGYDGAFLRSELRPSKVIKRQTGIRTEDSADWLFEQTQRYDDFEYTRSPFNPDEYKIRVGGMYHIVDEDVLYAVIQKGKGRKAKAETIEYLEESLREEKEKVRYLKEALRRGEITKSSQEQHDKLAKETNPELAMTRGLLAEFGRTSLYKEEPVKSEPIPVERPEVEPAENVGYKVEDLPLAPRDAMTFKDSGNLIRAPAVPAGAHGLVYHPEVARNPSSQICEPMVCTCQRPSVNYHMESRKSTPVPQNEASARTVRNKNRRLQRQQRKKTLEQYEQLYGPIPHGGATLHPHPTQPHGLIRNSTNP